MLACTQRTVQSNRSNTPGSWSSESPICHEFKQVQRRDPSNAQFQPSNYIAPPPDFQQRDDRHPSPPKGRGTYPDKTSEVEPPKLVSSRAQFYPSIRRDEIPKTNANESSRVEESPRPSGLAIPQVSRAQPPSATYLSRSSSSPVTQRSTLEVQHQAPPRYSPVMDRRPPQDDPLPKTREPRDGPNAYFVGRSR